MTDKLHAQIHHLTVERDALRLEVGEWVEKWEDAGHQINAMTAERDRYQAEASDRQREIGRLEAERDALAAQVAYMLDGMAQAISEETGDPIDALKTGMADQLPAAASRYLAAERMAQTYHGAGYSPTVIQHYGGAVTPEMSKAWYDWRRASGRE